MEQVESLSDHLYVTFSLDTDCNCLIRGKTNQRRWNLKKFNQDIFTAVLSWHEKDLGTEDHLDKNQLIKRLDMSIEDATQRHQELDPTRERGKCIGGTKASLHCAANA